MRSELSSAVGMRSELSSAVVSLAIASAEGGGI